MRMPPSLLLGEVADRVSVRSRGLSQAEHHRHSGLFSHAVKTALVSEQACFNDTTATITVPMV